MQVKFWGIIAVFILLGTVLASGCSSTPDQLTVSIGQQFSLPLGQTAGVKDENLFIKFVSVQGDSRCPKDVVCIQAGEAKCAMQLTHDGLASDLVFVDKGGVNGTSTASLDEFKFEFTLLPYPVSSQPSPSRAYRLTMTVTK